LSIFDEHDNIRTGRVWAYAIALITAITATIWALALYHAHTSGTRGTLDIQRQRGTAANRTHWSATFAGDYRTIQADQQNIQIAAQAANGPHSTVQDATNLTGIQMVCRNDVAAYNTDLANVLAVVPDGYPTVSLDAGAQCATDTTGLQTP
jgi:hypothetical protein